MGRMGSVIFRRTAVAVLALAVAVPVLAQDTAQETAPGTAQQGTQDEAANPPVKVARLSQLNGQVSVQPSGVTQWTQASDNYPMTTGDRLYADKDGQAELQMGQTVARVWHDTDLSVTNLTDDTTQLGLSQGTLRLHTFGLDANHTIEVDTPNGAITVMQPGDFRVDAYTGDGGTVVTVNSGQVQITGPSLSQELGSGQSVRLTGTNPITVSSLTMPGNDEFDQWSQNRDRQMLQSTSRRYVNPDTVGSDDLDQNGTWNQTPNYGPVWYPSGVPVGWVPYSTGHWVWVSPWGWTWVDSYPWGFAPFHYGRWAYVGQRWGWMPGPIGIAPIYAPALVGFVGGPSFGVGFGFGGGIGYSAWFPLGPGEPYFPWYPYNRRYFGRVNITNINNVTINRVTNITNINTTNYYNYYHNKNTFNKLRYANRNVATTAMSAKDFASGRAITVRTAIHPTAQQMAHAQVISHPFVKPTVSSVVPRPARSVPVSAARPRLITPHGEQRAVPGARPTAVPRTTAQQRTDTVPGNAARPVSRPDANLQTGRPIGIQQQPRNLQTRPATGAGTPRPLISRRAPPPGQPSFQQREPAYARDPGRPLGNNQLNNINRGRPAGPSRSQEFPPHPSWAPRPSAQRQEAAPRQEMPRQEMPRQEAPRQSMPHGGGSPHR